MSKRIAGKKVGRTKDAKKALFRGLVRSLVKNGAIKTSEARAKAVKPFVDRLLVLAKKDTLGARRMVTTRLGGDEKTAGRLFAEILPRVGNRTSGFTRIIRLNPRRGDASKRVRLEWVEAKNEEKEKPKTKKDTKKKTQKS